MQAHTKIYFKAFGFDVSDFVPCEVCGAKAVDIHHINARKMGGDPKKVKDCIENLQALCRSCHNNYGDVLAAMDYLFRIHVFRMVAAGVKYCPTKIKTLNR